MLGLLVSGSVALWAAIISTPFLIRYFRNRQIGQHIREDGPATHSIKAGTPTMGGIVIVGSVAFGYAIGHIGTEVSFSRTGYLAIGVVVAFGLIGYVDDYIKVHHRRSLGLNKRGKSAAQLVCAIAFAELAVHWAHASTALSFTRA
ncbi:MAG TPA: phospho-N-acetylmuramoyl-pentapeptide-transferase, partial [Acidimicrobiales bacterium]|nr:phospho-N-acetylmuramoyl-pentapeptide-transferase [Acidimicrobiales bacterium]